MNRTFVFVLSAVLAGLVAMLYTASPIAIAVSAVAAVGFRYVGVMDGNRKLRTQLERVAFGLTALLVVAIILGGMFTQHPIFTATYFVVVSAFLGNLVVDILRMVFRR